MPVYRPTDLKTKMFRYFEEFSQTNLLEQVYIRYLPFEEAYSKSYI